MLREYRKLSSMMYEKTKPIGYSILGDIEYYYDNIKDIKGKILEAGVGTGRVFIPFLERSLDMEGVDLSKDMLEICKNHLKTRNLSAKLYQENLITMNLSTKYDAIIMPSGSFCLITDYLASLDLLANLYKHLKTDGKMILDLLMPIGFKSDSSFTSLIEIDENKSILFNQYKMDIDYINQITHQINRYELIENGAIINSEVANFDIRWFGIQEFINILEKIGFRNISYNFDYNLDGDKSIVNFICFK